MNDLDFRYNNCHCREQRHPLKFNALATGSLHLLESILRGALASISNCLPYIGEYKGRGLGRRPGVVVLTPLHVKFLESSPALHTPEISGENSESTSSTLQLYYSLLYKSSSKTLFKYAPTKITFLYISKNCN